MPSALRKRARRYKPQGGASALSEEQARKLLDGPPADTLKGIRDRAILATLLYHDVSRDELCRLHVNDVQGLRASPRLRVIGKRSSIRLLPLHPIAQRFIEQYLTTAGHGDDAGGVLFRPTRTNYTDEGLNRPLDPTAIHRNVIVHYLRLAGISADVFGVGAE